VVGAENDSFHLATQRYSTTALSKANDTPEGPAGKSLPLNVQEKLTSKVKGGGAMPPAEATERAEPSCKIGTI